jgi:hypothetical protein
MPYITSDRVKEIRTQLKKEFPQFKLSVTRRHHSSVDIKILSGPLQFDSEHFSVNQYWLEDHYAETNPQAYITFKRMIEIADSGNYITTVDSDYGSIPKFYVWLEVGKWDKPYTVKLK